MPTVSTRRELLLAGGTVVVSGLAGCGGGGGSVDELESTVEEMESSLDTADSDLETGRDAMENENWEECASAAEGIRSNVDAAREPVEDAMSRAEESGQTPYAVVIGRMKVYADILEEMAGEIEAGCDAGENGDSEQLQQHRDNLEQLEEDRRAKLEEVESALDEIR